MLKTFRSPRLFNLLLPVFLLCLASTTSGSAQTFSVLHSFNGTDGSQPVSGVTQGLDGTFFGTTRGGGPNCAPLACGTVFKVGIHGFFTSLHFFCGTGTCGDGSSPQSPLFVGTFGTLYGTTLDGGNNGFGTIFSMTPSGTLTTLYSFCAQTDCSDGGFPNGIIKAWDGNFYGITTYPLGGEVFQFAAGKLHKITGICNLPGCQQIDIPGSLRQATDGNLYGITSFGGSHATSTNGGTVFKRVGGQLNALYSFCAEADCADGNQPIGLTEGADANFYGVTTAGGTAGVGTVFKITPTGLFTSLYSFCAPPNTPPHCPNGAIPNGGLVQGTDGNFYGVTADGGICQEGTVFRITPEGALTNVHGFCGGGGITPEGPLIQGTDGAFYGTAVGGGAYNHGTVFRLDVGLGPFVHPMLTFGRVGDHVTLLGTNLTGVTGVSFSGTPATIIAASATEIATTVPTGATSGSITVTTSNGTLTSDVVFSVLP